VDDFFASIFGALNLPAWAVLLIVVALAAASLFAGRWPPWAGVLLSALRAGAWAVLRKRKPELVSSRAAQKVSPPPPAPEPEPATSGEIVIETREPSEFDWDKRDG
jgi:hypothetical protein